MLNKVMGVKLYKEVYSAPSADAQKVWVRKGLGQPWEAMNIKEQIGEGATQEDMDAFYQKMANDINDFVSVRTADGKRSTWGPRPAKAAVPEQPASASITAEAPSSAVSAPSAGQGPAPEAPAFQTAQYQFMPPGTLAAQYAEQQARLAAGLKEKTKDAGEAVPYRKAAEKEVSGWRILGNAWENRGRFVDNLLGLVGLRTETYDYTHGKPRKNVNPFQHFANWVADQRKANNNTTI